MIKPSSEGAEDGKAFVSALKSAAEGKKGVRLVLNDRMNLNVFKLRNFAERIKIANNKVGFDIIFKRFTVACVRADYKVAFVPFKLNLSALNCGDNITGIHYELPLIKSS